MKKRILHVIYLLIVLVLIGSMGANQVKASPDSQNIAQNEAVNFHKLTHTPLDEARNLNPDLRTELSFSPKPVINSKYFDYIAFGGVDFKAWLPQQAEYFHPVSYGCVAIFTPGEVNDRFQASFPLAIPHGSEIYSFTFSGVDNFVSNGRHLGAHIARYTWDGSGGELVASLRTTDDFADPEAFWLYAVDIGHVVDSNYHYKLFIDLFPTWGDPNDMSDLRICQLGVGYILPTPPLFPLAFPGVLTKP